MNIKAIHHIAILTDDYERSKRFYTEVLGFGIVRETYRKERDSYKLDLSIDELTQRRFVFFNDPNGQPLELYEG